MELKSLVTKGVFVFVIICIHDKEAVLHDSDEVLYNLEYSSVSLLLNDGNQLPSPTIMLSTSKF